MNKTRRHRAKAAARRRKAALLAFARMDAVVRDEWRRVGFVGNENIRKMLRESEAWMRVHPLDRGADNTAESLRSSAEKSAVARGVSWSFVNSAERAVRSGYRVQRRAVLSGCGRRKAR